MSKALEPYHQLYTSTYDWMINQEKWLAQSFTGLNAEEMSELVNGYVKTINKAMKNKVIKDNPACYSIATTVKKELDHFKPHLPVINSLCNPGMRDRHWEALSSQLPFAFKPNDGLTLRNVLDDYKLQDYTEIVTKIGESAGKEYQIESALDKMEQAWKGVEFEVLPYKNTGTYVMKGVDEIVALLDEHVVMTQAMLFSAYKKPFDERINAWSTKLQTVSEVIEEWIQVQRQWLSLQSIFNSPDINKQLPVEGKRFSSVNKTWHLIMSKLYANPDVLVYCDDEALLTKLQDCNQLLNKVQKRLSDYLDKKRAAFARFYFLANEELLQILSQTQDPTAVQPHLKKCFENINTLKFSDAGLILAMRSPEGEEVPFVNAVNPAKKSVEHWLGEVEEEMKVSVKDFLDNAVRDYPRKERINWVRSWPGMCVLNGSQVLWTAEVEEALRNNTMEAYYEKWVGQLTKTVDLVRGDLSKIHRMIMGALIVLDVHARDVLETLKTQQACSPEDFSWIKQMRYYQEDSGLMIQMVQARYPYGYEYLGNTFRLVITPLTDRCYMTLMSALQLNLGGAPAGPAGTGKTETVKDLAKAVAKQCVVFNCSDGLNYLAMGKFFKGLASSGAWACFDEFNRIDVEVLSVVAQQIMTIWTAVRAGVSSFVFEETEIKLNPTCSVFITMNPGYAGRTELPDNLKALFRPVAMMVPDYALIAEISLYSFGFKNARSLSRKMDATFKLSSEQLSSQDHYDYGMRAVKTVITRAGILKRQDPGMSEDILLLRALRDVNIPKFLKADLPLFEGIISDLFPGIKKPEINHGDLMSSIVMTCCETNIQPVTSFLDKCVQLYETTVVRHGLMLVGPTGGGKTTSLRTLQKALTRLNKLDGFETILTYTMNPKAVTMGQLYGESDPFTGEWSDGILANIIRDCINANTPDKKWIVFDGPVDAIWIENMNTVLDDNKKLCLVSGEILALTSTMTMVFEVEDLAVASPATVSRCGMVYMEPGALGLAPLMQSWLQQLDDQFAGIIKPLAYYFECLLHPCIQFVRKECYEPVPSVDNNLTKSMLNLLTCMLKPYIPVEGAKDNADKLQAYTAFERDIEPMFLMCLIWSVGATVDKAGREKFSVFLRASMTDFNLQRSFPGHGLVYDFVFDLKSRSWIGWMDSQEPYKHDSRLSYSETIIPTMDSVRNTFFLKMLVENSMHALLTGSTGTGKTVNVQQFLTKLQDNRVPINMVFSAATSANQTEDMLFDKMTKRRQRVFGPALGKHFAIFVDDMNMPAREKYFAQPPIELLRQFMDHGGWFNRHLLQFMELVDISFIGAMGPPGGGRNPVTRRFTRHFNQIAQTDLEKDSLILIFSTIVKANLSSFSNEIQNLADGVVHASIEVYADVCRGLLPTPSKSHYTFNLRDLSAVFQGILSCSPRRTKTAAGFVRLWAHENMRVFKDRLIDQTDCEWLDALCASKMMEHFNMKWEEVIPKDYLLFGNYMDGMGTELKVYDEVPDVRKAAKLMEECLADYNDENTPMKLVMFPDAVGHVSRISRVLRQPGGNALLLGVGGSGRQSLTKLATYIAEYELYQVEVNKNYGMNEWREDLKKMLLAAGLKERPTVFLFNDTQITNESFLEDVNNILNSGDVPNLYGNEDMDTIFAACKIDCQRKNVPATKLNAFAQFLNRVRANLHIVLCMSPMGDIFRTRLRMFPSLVNCCTIDWFSDWPVSALRSVAQHSLQEEDLQLDNVSVVVETFGMIHDTVTKNSVSYREELSRYNYVTPTSYLELLNVFKFVLHEKRADVGGLRDKLQYGLDRLAQASEQVSQLQVDLREKQPRLEVTQKEVEMTMQQIAVDKKDAAATREVVAKQEAEARAKADECKVIKDEAQGELDKALPMLDKAVECLKELNKTHLDEVRNFKKPPAGVVLTMEAACLMLKQKLKLKISMKTEGMKKVPDYWDTAQKYLLKQPKLLLDTLKNYDKDNIPDKIIQSITPYINNPDFAVSKIESVSQACRAICMWVHAMFSYNVVAKEVEPKRIRLQGAEAELEKVTAALKDAKNRLRSVEDRLRSLEERFEAMVAQSESLQREVEQCKKKLERASHLVGGLGGERVRWEATVKTLQLAYDNLVGDVLVSSGVIAYLGAFTARYRKDMTEEWRAYLHKEGVKFTPNCTVRSTLADPVQIRAWNIAGLPADAMSIENGIIMSKARRWPLMIDPQGQASKFIKNMGDEMFEEGMLVVKLTDKSFLHTMENGIRFGKWVLIDNVLEDLDPALEPLLLQQVMNVAGAPHIRLGDNQIPYNDQFHLYMTTKLPNPHYAPELQVKVTLLNFTITPVGLEDQMLGTVVARESPEMEQKKNALVVQNAQMKKQLQDIEDNILKLLSGSTGDILDDEELINMLADSKKTSQEINERVAESEVVEKEIDAARQAYLPVATRASLLYFSICGLASIDPMYQYSLQWFVNLFIAGIANAPASPNLGERLKTLNTYFTKSLYENVCRSLFEIHKSLFSLLLTVRIMQGEGLVDDREWRFLVAGAAPTKHVPNPAPSWLTDDAWNKILAMSDLPVFAGFHKDFVDNLDVYQNYFDSAEPHLQAISQPWQNKLSTFQKLLVLRCLRSDKMAPAIKAFVGENLGPEFNEPPQFNLGLSFQDATAVTPLIFVLSRGADPASKLFDFAKEKGFANKIQAISLGQGQGVVAEKYIEEAKKRGSWVLLQNCHLAVSWLPSLERLVEDAKPEDMHQDFRLWLTSAPTPKFPVSVLQNGVKMTNEPPTGLRANMVRSYLGFSDDSLNDCQRPAEFKKLLFAMCFFHAVILDRRKFGALGWNVPYEFTENDLGVCVTQLRDFINMYEEIPYKVIHFLTYDINYGGRVTDSRDSVTIRTILDDFVNPDVLRDDYKFTPSGRYVSIAAGTHKDYLDYIHSMDAIPLPEVFGMHENADITSAQEETNTLFATILHLLPRKVAGGGKSRDQIIAEAAKSVYDRTPLEWEVDTVAKRYPTLYSESMNTVLVQEVIRYNKVISVMRSSLVDLMKAIKGEMVMTSALETMANSIFDNQVPEMWASVAYPSLMALAPWVNDLLARVKFIGDWVDKVPALSYFCHSLLITVLKYHIAFQFNIK